ncbi:MAG: hypothetical protein MPK09_03535, partial [Gammaproteobacteria bacterium]|nr:hypothetical protein [Gammaproteobacteria bacterium]
MLEGLPNAADFVQVKLSEEVALPGTGVSTGLPGVVTSPEGKCVPQAAEDAPNTAASATNTD